MSKKKENAPGHGHDLIGLGFPFSRFFPGRFTLAWGQGCNGYRRNGEVTGGQRMARASLAIAFI